MRKIKGWLFDLYAHPEKGVVLWFIGEDRKPYSFHQDFETVFYARGSVERLHDLGVFLRAKHTKEEVRLVRVTDKEDLFDGLQIVMGIRVSHPTKFRKIFREVHDNFSDLIFYDVDIPLTVRYAAANKVFMMAHCEIEAEPNGRLVSVKALDKPEDLDPQLPKLKMLKLKPDTDPSHKSPKHLIARFGKSYLQLSLDRPRELLNVLNSILSSYNPDVIHTYFGDSWIFPYLEESSKKTGIPFNPNRDSSLSVLRRKEVSFFNYGHAHYRAPQVHLRGRWHVDIENCMTSNKFQLVGAIEHARLSSLPLQDVARRSPGASIASMQNLTALKRNVLIPYEHQKGEIAKSLNEYYRAARGGLVLQPTPGIYQNVAVADFSSKMASIMIEFNVSPETVVGMDDTREGFEIPELGIKILSKLGLVPETLKPIRDKRLALKERLKSLDKNDASYQSTLQLYNVIEKSFNDEAIVDAIKWLTVVCYGRLRFANSVFGRLNSHEVVSYLSRKVITQAKLLAESMGFEVLHLYVDSLFLCKHDAMREDFEALADAIEEATHLPIEVENVYSWFAFPCSRQNPKISVANRFYGVAANGKHKIRGVAERRGDTCRFVANVQRQVIHILAKENDITKLPNLLPEVVTSVQSELTLLKAKEVPLEELVVSQTLSRDLDAYSVMSPMAVAVQQLKNQGILRNKGQIIRFIYTGRAPSVHAWDLPIEPDPQIVDVLHYKELVFRAVSEVLQPLGVIENVLRGWIFNQAGYVTPANLTNPSHQLVKQEMPLFADLTYLSLHHT
ncbi:MAG: hypothetical protein JNM46_00280 [Anaerolineales bacterium]|nr:hypothetical protein [Anaerolineales bacterium]